MVKPFPYTMYFAHFQTCRQSFCIDCLWIHLLKTILSTTQFPGNVLMMFSSNRILVPFKHVLLPLLNHKLLKTNPNYHLPKNQANITLVDFARIVYLTTSTSLTEISSRDSVNPLRSLSLTSLRTRRNKSKSVHKQKVHLVSSNPEQQTHVHYE